MIQFSTHSTPYTYENECGDFAIFEEYDDFYFLCVGDIGGHGSSSVYSIAQEIEAFIFHNIQIESLEELAILIHKHPSIEYTGMVLFLGKIFKKMEILKYVQIGNITGKLLRGGTISDLGYQDGVLGYSMPQNIKVNICKILKDDIFLLATDGLSIIDSMLYEKMATFKQISQISEYCLEKFYTKNDDGLCVAIQYLTENLPSPSQHPIPNTQYNKRFEIIPINTPFTKTKQIPKIQYKKNILIQKLPEHSLLCRLDNEESIKMNLSKITNMCALPKELSIRIITFAVESFLYNNETVAVYLESYRLQIVTTVQKLFLKRVEYIFENLSSTNTEDGKILLIIDFQLDISFPLSGVEFEEFKEELQLNLTTDDYIKFKNLRTTEKNLLEQAKLASMGEMIGTIAHQWRQPLSVISTLSTGFQFQMEYNGSIPNESLTHGLKLINENTQFLSTTIDDFRNFLKNEKQHERCKLLDILRQTVSLVKPILDENEIVLAVDLDTDYFIDGYPNELIQAFINIINNGRDILIEKGGEKIIQIKVTTQEKNLFITIKDSGGGVPTAIIDRIFEPYFTTKHQSQGTGIGLYMVRQIIVEHHFGKISISNEYFNHKENRYFGASFNIVLPFYEQAYNSL